MTMHACRLTILLAIVSLNRLGRRGACGRRRGSCTDRYVVWDEMELGPCAYSIRACTSPASSSSSDVLPHLALVLVLLLISRIVVVVAERRRRAFLRQSFLARNFLARTVRSGGRRTADDADDDDDADGERQGMRGTVPGMNGPPRKAERNSRRGVSVDVGGDR